MSAAEKDEKKGGVWKSLMSHIIEDEPARSEPAALAAQPSVTPASRASSPGFPPARPTFSPLQRSVAATPPDPAALERLQAKLSASTPQQYTAVMEHYQNFADVIPDESTRFKAALKAAGVKLPDLSIAIDSMIGVMDAMGKKFEEGAATNSDKITAALNEGRALTDRQIQEKQAAISQLEQEISGLSDSQNAAELKAKDDLQHINDVGAGFRSALAVVKKQLTDQKANIDSQLKATV